MWALLFSSIVAGLAVKPVEANPASYMQLFDNAVITIQSPQNGSSYKNATVPLEFTVRTNNEIQPKTCYFLNDQRFSDVKTPVVSNDRVKGYYGYQDGKESTFYYIRYNAEGKTVLTDLKEGIYNLTVARYWVDSHNPPLNMHIINTTTIFFTIGTTIPTPQPTATPIESTAPNQEHNEPVPLIQSAGVALTIIAVSTIVAVYIKMRNRKSVENSS